MTEHGVEPALFSLQTWHQSLLWSAEPSVQRIFSQVSVFWARNNASKSFSTFSNEGSRAIHSMSCLALLFTGVSWFTWRLGGKKALGKNSKGSTLASWQIVMARKETNTDLSPLLLVQLLGLLFSLCRTLNIFLKLCWDPFISPSTTFKDMG